MLDNENRHDHKQECIAQGSSPLHQVWDMCMRRQFLPHSSSHHFSYVPIHQQNDLLAEDTNWSVI